MVWPEDWMLTIIIHLHEACPRRWVEEKNLDLIVCQVPHLAIPFSLIMKRILGIDTIHRPVNQVLSQTIF